MGPADKPRDDERGVVEGSAEGAGRTARSDGRGCDAESGGWGLSDAPCVVRWAPREVAADAGEDGFAPGTIGASGGERAAGGGENAGDAGDLGREVAGREAVEEGLALEAFGGFRVEVLLPVVGLGLVGFEVAVTPGGRQSLAAGEAAGERDAHAQAAADLGEGVGDADHVAAIGVFHRAFEVAGHLQAELGKFAELALGGDVGLG